MEVKKARCKKPQDSMYVKYPQKVTFTNKKIFVWGKEHGLPINGHKRPYCGDKLS